ncbi:MAG: hypothetical protein CVU65_06085 [Deltaproteobacteria bacterium HGW-Deltaproteobacteria-22]|nr:MAG: hypothetical protein CVU65_06085 [Deltaproteobacteria bacterium HGW-Deltaproteobacteria-22]
MCYFFKAATERLAHRRHGTRQRLFGIGIGVRVDQDVGIGVRVGPGVGIRTGIKDGTGRRIIAGQQHGRRRRGRQKIPAGHVEAWNGKRVFFHGCNLGRKKNVRAKDHTKSQFAMPPSLRQELVVPSLALALLGLHADVRGQHRQEGIWTGPVAR